MLDSGKSADELIKEIIDEVDVATPTSEQTLVDELNGLERLLYSEVIKEQAVEEVDLVFKSSTPPPINPSPVIPEEGEGEVV